MRNRLKKLKGGLPHIGDSESYDGDGTQPNPFLAALANPDLLSEDARMFPERDFDQEEARAAYLEAFKKALKTLTEKQRAVLESMSRLNDQMKVAAELGIDQSTVSRTMTAIEKKINKGIHKIQNAECDVRNYNEE